MQPLDYASPKTQSSAGLSVIIAAVFYAIAALPSGMLLGIYLSFALASVHLGRMPSYGNPDPKTLPDWVMSPSVLALPGMALVPGVVAFLSSRFRGRLPRIVVIAPVALAVLAWTLFITDPFGAMNWWVD